MGDKLVSSQLSRNEVLSLVFRLTLFGALTYFGVRWMVKAIDPTRKQKIEAQKRVSKGHYYWCFKKIGLKNKLTSLHVILFCIVFGQLLFTHTVSIWKFFNRYKYFVIMCMCLYEGCEGLFTIFYAILLNLQTNDLQDVNPF